MSMATRFAVLLTSIPSAVLTDAGISREAVANWKSSRSIPTAKMFRRIADCTGISILKISQAVAEDVEARRMKRGNMVS